MKAWITLLLLQLGRLAAAQDTAKPQDSSLSWGGYLEAYYAYDTKKPPGGNRPAFIYSHNRHNEFNINLAMIRVSYADARTRASLAIGAGTYMNANYAAEPGVLKNLYEANAGYRLGTRKNIWIDIGILPSHIGFESAVSKDCWALTRSIQADNTPYFEGGARLGYTTDNTRWTFSILALNGWQRITRVPGNSLMSWGTQIQFRPDDKLLLNSSTFIGSDKPDSLRQWRYFHNFYGIFQCTKRLEITLGFDLGAEQSAPGSSQVNTWYAPVAILRFTPANKWAFALRGEYYRDVHGVIIYTGTPRGFRTSGFSANMDYLPAKHVALRLEARTLHSKDAIFNRVLRASRNDAAVTSSIALSF